MSLIYALSWCTRGILRSPSVKGLMLPVSKNAIGSRSTAAPERGRQMPAGTRWCGSRTSEIGLICAGEFVNGEGRGGGAHWVLVADLGGIV